MYKIGDKFINKNGKVGTIVDVNGVLTLQILNKLGKIEQNIVLRKIDLTKFERVM